MPDSQPVPFAAAPAARRTHVWLGVLAIAGLALRLVLVQLRWINPDEGAHLMDASLVLHGLLPEVDFKARQPFYVYLLALWLHFTGGGFEGVRVLMALLDTLVGALVYAIGLRVLPARSALLGAALYLLLPFTIFWAPLVHTEPLAMVLVAGGLLGVARRLTGGGTAPGVAAAGACLALGCYVRQSALAGVLAALVLLALHQRPLRAALRDAAWLGGGYAAVVAVVLAWYARRLSLSELWASSVNPLRLPIESLLRIIGPAPGIIGPLPVGTPGGSAPAFRSEIQAWDVTLTNLRATVPLTALVVAGCIAFLVHWALLERRRAPDAAALRLGGSVVLAWFGSLVLLYGYWILHRGFYPQYAVEFLPPLALGAGHAIAVGWASSDRIARWRLAAALVAALIIAFAAHGPVPDGRYTAMAYAALAGVLALVGVRRTWVRFPAAPVGAAAAAAGIVWLALRWMFHASPHPADLIAGITAIGGLVLAARARRPEGVSPMSLLGRGAVGALGLATLVFSARVLEPRYSCVWSPATLREVAAHLQRQTPPGAPVMSGAVIWEFVAGRPPFATISHPLAFQGGGNAAALAVIDRALVAAPPAVIVLDGYTELTFLAQSEAVTRTVENGYEETRVILGSKYPVRILVPRK